TSGSCTGEAVLNGSKASRVTTHGEMDEPKFFARKGPNGTYSQDWISLADQSLKTTIPKMASSASLVEILSPISVFLLMMKAISSSKSSCLDGPKNGLSA